MTTRRRQEIERNLDRHLTNGLIKDWKRQENGSGYAIRMSNGLINVFDTIAETWLFSAGLDCASQAWRTALGDRHGVKDPASARSQEEFQAIGRELGETVLEPELERLLTAMQDWAERGALGWVLATSPIGKEWKIGIPTAQNLSGHEIITLGHDPQSCVDTAIALLAGLGTGALWGVREAFKKAQGYDPIDDPRIRAMFGQEPS